MRVLYIAPRYAPAFGGVERHVAALATGMLRRGGEAEVVTQTTGGVVGPAVVDGVPVHRSRAINRSGAFGVPPGLFAWVARNAARFDVVHAHGYHGLPALAGLLGRGTPLVLTPHYHGEGHTGTARRLHVLYRPIGRQLFRRASAVVCVSEAERRLVERDFPLAAPRTSMIPNGVDLREIRETEPASDARPFVLVIGRLERYKRIDRLIEALASLPEEWRLVVVGDGPDRAALERHAAALQAGRVVFAGRVSDDCLRGLLRAADVVASLSLHEAYGLTLVEGLAAGAAIVASDIPAHREILAVHATATLVPVDASPEAVAKAVDHAAEGGRSEAAPPGLLDWEEVVDRTADLYRSVAEPGSGRC